MKTIAILASCGPLVLSLPCNDRISSFLIAHLEGFVLKVVTQTATSLQLTASGSAVDDQVVQGQYRASANKCVSWM